MFRRKIFNEGDSTGNPNFFFFSISILSPSLYFKRRQKAKKFLLIISNIYSYKEYFSY